MSAITELDASHHCFTVEKINNYHSLIPMDSMISRRQMGKDAALARITVKRVVPNVKIANRPELVSFTSLMLN